MEQALAKAGVVKKEQPAPTFTEDSVDQPQKKTLPLLIVFDLDNTLWTPELYQLRLPSSRAPIAGKDVQLFPEAAAILQELAEGGEWTASGTRVAIASRTHKKAWAENLLQQFEIVPGMTLHELICNNGKGGLIEIRTGSKLDHFRRLQKASGVEYEDMLFFDDAFGGKYGNCEPVARELGVLSAHCPKGLNFSIWDAALDAFAAARTSGERYRHHAVVSEKHGVKQVGAENREKKTGANGSGNEGRVKMWNEEKGYGFIESPSSDGDVFAHRSVLAGGLESEDMVSGLAVRFHIGTDAKTGRRCATSVEPAEGISKASGQQAPRRWSTDDPQTGTEDADSLDMPCLSLCQPFATLILNGVKTIETRNNPELLKPYAGQEVMIRIGMRDWPDDKGWRRQMEAAGYSKEDMERLSKPPPSVKKGDIAGVVRLGKTMPNSQLARVIPGGWPSVEQGVCASKEDMMKYSTPIETATWLEKPLRAKGNFAGVWFQNIPASSLENSKDAK
eukprot:gene13326-15745_t